MKKFVSLVFCITLFTTAVGFAYPVDPIAQSEVDALTLAQAVVAEADSSTPDHIAIAYVLTKRWNIYRKNNELTGTQTFAWFVQRYCSVFKINSPRARLIKLLPWGNPVVFPKNTSREKFTQNWTKVRQTIEKFYSKMYKDPCPSALHWGGTMDSPANIRNGRTEGWKKVSCGKTRNIFYRPVYKPTAD